MTDRKEQPHFRLHLWLIRIIGIIIPRRLRTNWKQEWEAELRYRERTLARWDQLNWRGKLDLLRRSFSAFWDALVLQQRRLEDDMIQDLRYGVRMFIKQPGFTIIAVLTLALGIGANTAIFSVVNAVLLRSLPYQNADELEVLFFTNTTGEFEWPLSPASYLHLKNQNKVFTDIAALSNKGWPANLTGSGEPERLQGFEVSANLFQVLGVAPIQGRTFLTAEDSPGNNRVVVISHELWQRRFGGNPELIGKEITLNGAGYSVIGVMPADFRFFTKTQVWTPLALTPDEANNRQSNYMLPIARLKPGVAREQARAEIEKLSREQINNPNSSMLATIKQFQKIMSQDVQRTLWVMFAAVGFVLLIACVNVANLLLARSSVRRKELTIRMAMGARRLRIVRQLMAESVLLAIIGGICGLLLANWGIKFLIKGLPEFLVVANSNVALLKLDTSALGFMFLLSLLTTVIFGLAPAMQTSKINLNEALKDGGRSDTQGRRQNRLRGLLVVAEIALSLILLVGAGLMIKSFWRLNQVNPGINPVGVLMAQIDPAGDGYREFDQLTVFYTQLLDRVTNIPGVQHAGIINSLDSSWGLSIIEHPPVPEEQRPQASSNQVSQGYFRAMGIPLRAGRFFTDRDTRGATPVIIIDETLARRYFPNEDPIGKHLEYQHASREIVGVVGATKRGSLSEEAFPRTYMPYQQVNWGSMSLVIKAQAGDPTKLIPAVRRELSAIDQNQPIHSFSSLERSVDEWMAPQRFSTLLLGTFAALAALLALVGIYGVMSYSVTQRTHEIGIRMALGAPTSNVLSMVMRQGLWLTATGIAAGLIGAYLLTGLMKTLLFEVSATDPLTFISISLLLVLTAALACWVPARRAAQVDPMVALRNE